MRVDRFFLLEQQQNSTKSILLRHIVKVPNRRKVLISNRYLPELRSAAQGIFDRALQSVDAREAVQRVVAVDGPTLKIFDHQFDTTTLKVFVVAIGKAAPAMAAGLFEILGERISEGLMTGPSRSGQSIFPSDTWQVFKGGHPLPNAQSLAAAKAAFELLQRAEAARALVIFLISGGGSTMIEWPRAHDISLDDLRQANRALVSSGATIKEINAVRQAFSAIKGGRLASLAPKTTQINLIISDVNPGEEAHVASGPTIFPTSDRFDPREVMDHYQLRPALPESILRTIDDPSSSLTVPFNRFTSEKGERELRQSSYVLLENCSALNAAAKEARRMGFKVKIADLIVEQPIELGCNLLLAHLSELRRQADNSPVCLISGGEFRCPVRGSGEGGRNLETVLRCALELDRNAAEGHTVVLSGGTDGIDGNSPAAGAIADETTIARARGASLEAVTFLANSDSFSFFDQLGEAIVTGPTGTNVRDLRVLLYGQSGNASR
jgi:glycerate 2-kinase